MTDWIGLVIYAGFGVLAFATYGTALYLRIMAWRKYHDSRARRMAVCAVCLFVVAALGVTSVGMAYGNGPQDVRRVLAGLAWGAFAAAGVFFFEASRPATGKLR
jgi:hypothetical protein